jgi:hypothetical protein
MGDIKQDWIGHACSWQNLYLECLPSFTILAKLNLSSLKKLSVGCHVVSVMNIQYWQHCLL